MSPPLRTLPPSPGWKWENKESELFITSTLAAAEAVQTRCFQSLSPQFSSENLRLVGGCVLREKGDENKTREGRKGGREGKMKRRMEEENSRKKEGEENKTKGERRLEEENGVKKEEEGMKRGKRLRKIDLRLHFNHQSSVLVEVDEVEEVEASTGWKFSLV